MRFLPAVVAEEITLLDYFGYDYTTPIPRDFSTPGQLYVGLGEVSNIHPDALIMDPLYEYTFVLQSGELVSETVIVPGMFTQYYYESGTFLVYKDDLTAYDYDAVPHPSTFEDGDAVIGADFMGLTITVNIVDWTASLYGTLDFYCDEGWDMPCYFGWTFAGNALEAGIPAGYMWCIDGEIFVEEEVGTQNATWGDVKSLFR